MTDMKLIFMTDAAFKYKYTKYDYAPFEMCNIQSLSLHELLTYTQDNHDGVVITYINNTEYSKQKLLIRGYTIRKGGEIMKNRDEQDEQNEQNGNILDEFGELIAGFVNPATLTLTAREQQILYAVIFKEYTEYADLIDDDEDEDKLLQMLYIQAAKELDTLLGKMRTLQKQK